MKKRKMKLKYLLMIKCTISKMIWMMIARLKDFLRKISVIKFFRMELKENNLDLR